MSDKSMFLLAAAGLVLLGLLGWRTARTFVTVGGGGRKLLLFLGAGCVIGLVLYGAGKGIMAGGP